MSQDSNNYWEQLERLEKLIRASELKAGVVFSFHSQHDKLVEPQ